MNIIIHQPYSFLANNPHQEASSCLVLLSSYNGKKYIEEQITSILAQENVNIQLLIRDDGSSDGTIEVLKKLQSEHPREISIILGSNVGLYKSIATLIDAAPSCDYVAFSDQDDVWDKDKLFIGISALKHYNAGFYSSASRLVDQKMNPIGRTTAAPEYVSYYLNGPSKIFSSGMQGCTIIISREFFLLLKNSSYPCWHGHDTWITCVGLLLFKTIYDSESHMCYRQHDLSWTGNRKSRVRHLFTRIRFFLLGLKRYQSLAKDILLRFGNSLDDNDKAVLQCIAEKKPSISGRINDLRKYHFGKYGLLRNLVFKIYYIFK